MLKLNSGLQLGLMLCFWMRAEAVTPEALPSAGLVDLPLLGSFETRMVSPENPTGEKGRGAMAIPDTKNPALPFSGLAQDLGQGWKVSPFIKVKGHQTVKILDVDGPGMIQHIWMTTSPNWKKSSGRASILRFYWDAEKTPSIEVPMTDFFAVGHDQFAPVNSLAVIVNPTSALNCYWPMPFRKHALITVTNDSDEELGLLTYQITYATGQLSANAGYFHAQWRRATTDPTRPEYVILDGVNGRGRYVGTFLAWTQLSAGWFGEGEVKFFIDDDDTFPTVVGTGTEDYFGASYDFMNTYSTAYNGATLLKPALSDDPADAGPPKWSLYRWHLMDPVNFQENLKVTIQALGWPLSSAPLRYRPLSEDIASVAYWYQAEPHSEFPKLPPLSQRLPR